MEERTTARTHKIIISERATGTFTGVIDVLSFDVSEILLETTCGMLMIKGRELHVKRLLLEKGEVDIEGQIDSLMYSNVPQKEKSSGSFFERIFR